MYIINEDDFQRVFFVPDSQGQNQIDDAVKDALMQYIDGYVRKYLKENLGFANFKNLNSNITAGVLNENAPAKWLSLVNGTTYTYNGNEYRWDGLLYTEGTFISSLLVANAFYEWKRGKVSTPTSTGDVVLEIKGGSRANPADLILRAWNDFVRMHQGEIDEFNPYVDYSEIQEPKSGYVNMRTFLQHNEADYPKAPIKVYQFVNRFGI